MGKVQTGQQMKRKSIMRSVTVQKVMLPMQGTESFDPNDLGPKAICNLEHLRALMVRLLKSTLALSS